MVCKRRDHVSESRERLVNLLALLQPLARCSRQPHALGPSQIYQVQLADLKIVNERMNNAVCLRRGKARVYDAYACMCILCMNACTRSICVLKMYVLLLYAWTYLCVLPVRVVCACVWMLFYCIYACTRHKLVHVRMYAVYVTYIHKCMRVYDVYAIHECMKHVRMHYYR